MPIGNVTPADAYVGRHTAIIERRQKPKNSPSKTAAWIIKSKRLNIKQDEKEPPLNKRRLCPIYPDDGHQTIDLASIPAR